MYDYVSTDGDKTVVVTFTSEDGMVYPGIIPAEAKLFEVIVSISKYISLFITTLNSFQFNFTNGICYKLYRNVLKLSNAFSISK